VDDRDIRAPAGAEAPPRPQRDARQQGVHLTRFGGVGEQAGGLDHGDRVGVLVEDLE
jgi:hypothetical protein